MVCSYLRHPMPQGSFHLANPPPLMLQKTPFYLAKDCTPCAANLSFDSDSSGSLLAYRFRSACARLHAASPLKALRLRLAKPLHPLLIDEIDAEAEDPGTAASSLTSVAARSSPLSRSVSVPCGLRGMGMAEVGDSFLVAATRS